MTKYTRKYFFAPGKYVKLSFLSQNKGLPQANKNFKFKKLEEQWKANNPSYFTPEYQATSQAIVNANDAKQAKKMTDLCDKILANGF